MVDKEITKLIKDIDKNHKDLLTKYNVLVKRTSSIISSLSELNAKIDYLAEMMSMFELAEENEEEEFDPYSLESEDYEDIDNDDDNL